MHMARSNPSSIAFPSSLFGQSALSGLRKTLRGISPLNTIPDFLRTFGVLIPDSLFGLSSAGANSRARRFTPHVTFWAFLAQTLTPETSCRNIVRKVQAWWLSVSSKADVGSSSSAAYTKARKRLNPDTIKEVSHHLAHRLEQRVSTSQLWLGRHVKIVDGTTVSMPDTQENQDKYPQPTSQKTGCGFPQMRVVGLFSLASGALLDLAKSSIRVHESILFNQLIPAMKKGDVVLADRGFCSFHTFWKLSETGIDSLMRLNAIRKVDFDKGCKLGTNDRLLTWKKPAQRPKGCTEEEYRNLPPTMTLRHVRLEISSRGHRTQTITLVTTLVDPTAYPIQALGELYLSRWMVELHFREIKITLGMDVLRCQTPAMAEKEIMMHAVSYNLIRSLMQEAATSHQIDLSRISFKGTLDTMREWRSVLESMRGHPRKHRALLEIMLRVIASDLVPYRPNREEPRAKKRRAKNYHLLTKHRSEMKTPAHRNRPK